MKPTASIHPSVSSRAAKPPPTAHRRRLEDIETTMGSAHYRPKIHTLLTSPLELATHPRVLDAVELIIGPDILLYNVNYIIKEPGSSSYVSWHQDLTYWGFNADDQVSMWLALSPATAESGCMRMVPGSHKTGRRQHEVSDDSSNVLYSGQTVRDVNEENAVMCPLLPGQASFHHGWTLHASMPNHSTDRRIGLNVQYIAPHMKQTKNKSDSAMLVRGQDDYHNYETDIGATTDLDPAAIEMQRMLEDRYRKIAAAT